jgi:hypothetical protein
MATSVKQSEIKQSEIKQSESKQSEIKQPKTVKNSAKTAKTAKSANTEMVSEEDKALGQMYQKKTDKQHVLDNPDTYTGSMEMTEYDTYIFDEETKAIIAKQITIIPGLYKLFDEGVVNCRDHCVRMAQIISSAGAALAGAALAGAAFTGALFATFAFFVGSDLAECEVFFAVIRSSPPATFHLFVVAHGRQEFAVPRRGLLFEPRRLAAPRERLVQN